MYQRWKYVQLRLDHVARLIYVLISIKLRLRFPQISPEKNSEANIYYLWQITICQQKLKTNAVWVTKFEIKLIKFSSKN